MARDNGSRGSYRHFSPTTLKMKQEANQDPRKPSESSPTGSDNSAATPPTSFQNLKTRQPDLIIDQPLVAAADSLFDRAPDLLNVRFPVMRQSVPGSMPRPSPSFYFASLRKEEEEEEEEERDRVTWYDLIIANIIFGAAAIGFMVIMYDGLSTIAAFIWGSIMGRLSIIIG